MNATTSTRLQDRSRWVEAGLVAAALSELALFLTHRREVDVVEKVQAHVGSVSAGAIARADALLHAATWVQRLTFAASLIASYAWIKAAQRAGSARRDRVAPAKGLGIGWTFQLWRSSASPGERPRRLVPFAWFGLIFVNMAMTLFVQSASTIHDVDDFTRYHHLRMASAVLSIASIGISIFYVRALSARLDARAAGA